MSGIKPPGNNDKIKCRPHPHPNSKQNSRLFFKVFFVLILSASQNRSSINPI